MAIFYPSLNKLAQLSQNPTEGEKFLLDFLSKLNDEHEIFYQSYLNGLRPDIIIMKKNYGILIIEVKDWDPECYSYHGDEWELRDDSTRAYHKTKVGSPLKQVIKYKQTIMDQYIPGFLENKFKNKNYYALINCAVYFHKFSKTQLPKSEDEYINYLTQEDLNFNDFDRLLEKCNMDSSKSKSKYFDDKLYQLCKRIFQPPIHLLEEGVRIKYSDLQKKLIDKASNNPKMKIKGVAGSGKTKVLAKMAVDSVIRTKRPILIVTYNISLCNYIHDKINEVRQEFPWDKFHIINYHRLMGSLFLSKDTKINLEDYDKKQNIDYLLHNKYGKDNIDAYKYATILVDEIQDFKKHWLENVCQFLLDPNKGLIVFGDEKQNIYNNEVDKSTKNPITTGISGAWNKLNQSFRSYGNIFSLLQEYQMELADKYNIESQEQQSTLPFKKGNIHYYYQDKLDIQYLLDCYQNFITKYDIHESDTCFLSEKIAILKKADYLYRSRFFLDTQVTFESYEEDLEIKKILGINKNIEIDKPGVISKSEAEKILKLSPFENIESIIAYISKTTGEKKVAFEDVRRIYSMNKKKYYHTDFKSHGQHYHTDYKGYNQYYNYCLAVRRNRKVNFWPKRGITKFSTIHSFKGFESDTVVLIIDAKMEEDNVHELIYTSLSRAKRNLIIFNCGNIEIDNFFQDESRKKKFKGIIEYK